MFFVSIISIKKKNMVSYDQVFDFFKTIFIFFLILILFGAFKGFNLNFDFITKLIFSIISVMSTTGFIIYDYTNWGDFFIFTFFIITFVGGCTGSTAGGIKIYRISILFKAIGVNINRSLKPDQVDLGYYDGKKLNIEVFSSVVLFIVLFLLSTFFITALLSACGMDFITAFSAAATSIANVGPGLGDSIGPVSNFSQVSDSAKIITSFAMILGRLEIIPVIAMLSKNFIRF